MAQNLFTRVIFREITQCDENDRHLTGVVLELVLPMSDETTQYMVFIDEKDFMLRSHALSAHHDRASAIRQGIHIIDDARLVMCARDSKEDGDIPF